MFFGKKEYDVQSAPCFLTVELYWPPPRWQIKCVLVPTDKAYNCPLRLIILGKCKQFMHFQKQWMTSQSESIRFLRSILREEGRVVRPGNKTGLQSRTSRLIEPPVIVQSCHVASCLCAFAHAVPSA